MISTNKTYQFIIFIFQFTSILFGQKTAEVFENDQDNNYHYRETYRFDSVPDIGNYTISISNVEGEIFVKGHSGSGAELMILRNIKSITEKKAKQLVDYNKIQVFHIEDDNLIQVKSEKTTQYQKDIETRFEWNIPMYINLDLETAGGDIDVRDIRGESMLKTSGGDMILSNMMGRIEIQTFGGNVDISHIDGLIRVHTSGGNIEIVNSEGQFNASTSGGDLGFLHLNGNIDAQTTGGSITLENIEGESVNCRTSGGDIHAEIITADLKGETSGGNIDLKQITGHVDISTLGGNIETNQVVGSLKCHTSGGEIQGIGIIGAVNASTVAGDIEMLLGYDSGISGYNISLETKNGDIFIQVPTGLPVNVDVEIYGNVDATDLNSDISINVQSSNFQVTGTGKILGGTIPLWLRATDGTVTIKQE